MSFLLHTHTHTHTHHLFFPISGNNRLQYEWVICLRWFIVRRIPSADSTLMTIVCLLVTWDKVVPLPYMGSSTMAQITRKHFNSWGAASLFPCHECSALLAQRPRAARAGNTGLLTFSLQISKKTTAKQQFFVLMCPRSRRWPALTQSQPAARANGRKVVSKLGQREIWTSLCSSTWPILPYSGFNFFYVHHCISAAEGV